MHKYDNLKKPADYPKPDSKKNAAELMTPKEAIKTLYEQCYQTKDGESQKPMPTPDAD